jgi:hypothetical protein
MMSPSTPIPTNNLLEMENEIIRFNMYFGLLWYKKGMQDRPAVGQTTRLL